MYNADDLLQVLREKPFQPVELQLSSGESIQLTHPEQAAVTDTDAVMLLLPGSREGRVSWRLVGLDHVVSIGSRNGWGQQAPRSGGTSG